MKVISTPIQDLKIIDPDKFDDSRGYYLKSFEKKAFLDHGIDFNIFNNKKREIRTVMKPP